MTTQPRNSGPNPALWLSEAQFRMQPVGSIPYDGGTQAPRTLVLPQAGYIQAVNLIQTLSGSQTVANTGLDSFGKAGGVGKQVRLFINTEGELYNLGWFMGRHVMAMDDEYNNQDGRIYNYSSAGGPLAVNSTQPSGSESVDIMPGLNTFNNLWQLRLPLALYLANSPWPIGLYNTAIQNLTVQLQAEFNPLEGAAGVPGSGVYLGGTAQTSPALSGSMDVNEQYFEPIPTLQAQPPLRYIHRWTQFTTQIAQGTGYTDVPLPGRQNYTRFLFAIVDGASSSTLVLSDNVLSEVQLMYGVNTIPYDWTYNQLNFRMRQQYGKMMDTWTPGVYFIDFLADTHTTRDWFNVSQVTNPRVRVFTNGAHTGVGSYILMACEEVLTLQGAGFNQTAQYVAAQQAAMQAQAA